LNSGLDAWLFAYWLILGRGLILQALWQGVCYKTYNGIVYIYLYKYKKNDRIGRALMIRGEKVILRPVKQEDLPLLQQWRRDPILEGEFNNFGMSAEGEVMRRFEQDGLFGSGYKSLMVTDLDDHPLGSVGFHHMHYGPGEMSIAYNIGISLLPEQRGHGYGVEAQRLLAGYLFATYPIMRVEATTDIENIPEQRALEKAGFTRDGVIRKAQWRAGAWHDMVLYSKLRGE
jgi:aminoglycoside 6'-N-acetyltransferase